MEMIVPMLNESIIDIKIAFKIYLENKKEYILTFFLFLVGIFLLVITGMLLIRFVILDNLLQFEEVIRILVAPIILLILLFVFFLLLSYARTIFGLSNDIMTSGELFTEFRRSIAYFKKFWLYFAILSLPYVLIIATEQMISLFALFNIIKSGEGNRILFVGIKLSIYVLDLTLNITLIELFPSLIVVRNVKQCIRENFTIVRQNYQRMIYSITSYYLIFRGPMFLVDMTRMLLVTSLDSLLLFNLLFLVFTVMNVLVGFPILSLISTRIYNTTILKRKLE